MVVEVPLHLPEPGESLRLERGIGNRERSAGRFGTGVACQAQQGGDEGYQFGGSGLPLPAGEVDGCAQGESDPQAGDRLELVGWAVDLTDSQPRGGNQFHSGGVLHAELITMGFRCDTVDPGRSQPLRNGARRREQHPDGTCALRRVVDFIDRAPEIAQWEEFPIETGTAQLRERQVARR